MIANLAVKFLPGGGRLRSRRTPLAHSHSHPAEWRALPVRPFPLVEFRIDMSWPHDIHRLWIASLPPDAQAMRPPRYRPVGTRLRPIINQTDQRVISPEQ